MEIAYEPYKKISFRSHLQFDTPEDFAATVALAAPVSVPAQATLRWANGVLFSAVGFQPSDSITKEYIAGHLIWDHVDFALMPQYRAQIALPEKPMVLINVINLSQHALFGPLGEWIKNNLANKKEITQRGL